LLNVLGKLNMLTWIGWLGGGARWCLDVLSGDLEMPNVPPFSPSGNEI
jgi:hypothetical protein